MCGILGIVNNSKVDLEISNFRSALMTMLHRGPDNQTVVAINDKVYLGHVRLSIIDLDEKSNQPFTDVSGIFHLVYNGEIYNYLEIKKELITLGYNFRTQSDTEVLLTSYIAWEECVNRFNGMWAFAIFDNANGSLFCSRDRFGVKPFYYTEINGHFVFASEIKAIISLFPELRKPNYTSISSFLHYSVGAESHETWFDGIFRLPPANNGILENNNFTKSTYWNYPTEEKSTINDSKLTSDYIEIFKNSISLRLRSDVPVGITLSSGVDSNSILFASPEESRNTIQAFSVSVNSDDYSKSELKNFKTNNLKNEAQIAKEMAKSANVDFVEINFNYEHYTQKLSHLIYHMECGHHSFSVMPYYNLMEGIKGKSVVLLEGQGSDELLAGYYGIMGPVYVLDQLKKFKFKSATRALRELNENYMVWGSLLRLFKALKVKFASTIYNSLFLGISTLINDKLNSPKFPAKQRNNKNSLLKNITIEQHKELLVDFLHYGDTLSMANSLESRLPFMDYRLVEYVFKLPSELLIQNGMGKYFHRNAMKNIVPDEILNEKIKLGFNTPMSVIFKATTEESPLHILLSQRSLDRGLFKEEGIKKLYNQLDKSHNHIQLMYRALSIELWFRNFIDQEEIVI